MGPSDISNSRRLDDDSLLQLKNYGSENQGRYLYLDRATNKLVLGEMTFIDRLAHLFGIHDNFKLETISRFLQNNPPPSDDKEVKKAVDELNRKIEKHNKKFFIKNFGSEVPVVTYQNQRIASATRAVLPSASRPGTATAGVPQPPHTTVSRGPEGASAGLAAGAASATRPLPTAAVPPSVSVAEANQRCLAQVRPKIIAGSTLPGEGGGTMMTGEEHIYAMLYDKLIREDGRNDVVILPLGPGNTPPSGLSSLDPTVRFVISPCSVQNNTHNTVLVIDRTSKKYFYFDSLGLTDNAQLATIIQNHKNQGLIPDDFSRGVAPSTIQNDGWSCGFHAVQNAVGVVTGSSQGDPIAGSALRARYAHNYNSFVETNANSNPNYGRMQRRQKMYLREALKKLVENKPSHPLYTLYDQLVTNLSGDDREKSILEFRDAFLQSYPGNVACLRVLASAANGSGEIFQILNAIPFSYEEIPPATITANQDVAFRMHMEWMSERQWALAVARQWNIDHVLSPRELPPFNSELQEQNRRECHLEIAINQSTQALVQVLQRLFPPT